MRKPSATGSPQTNAAWPPPRLTPRRNSLRNSNCRREFRRGVKRGGGQAAFVCGEPVADGFRIGRKCRSLADPQEETRPKQTADASADGRTKGSHAPDHRADDTYAADAKSIQQQPGRQLEQRVGPVVSA